MIKYLAIHASLLFLLVPLCADSTNAPPVSSTSPAPAATAPGKVLAPSNDVGLTSDGKIVDMDSYEVRIGEMNAPGGECYILPFHLPLLQPGQQFAHVHLRMQLHDKSNEGNTLGNADLYGIGVRDTNKALPADYYQGAHNASATLIQGKFLTPDSIVRTDAEKGPFIETSADADTALTQYFNDAAAQPDSAGKFVFLRISYDLDTIPTGNSAYLILTSGADGDNEPPILTYTITSGAAK
jgi:hypothetical protein